MQTEDDISALEVPWTLNREHPGVLIPSLNKNFKELVESVAFNSSSSRMVAAALSGGSVEVADLLHLRLTHTIHPTRHSQTQPFVTAPTTHASQTRREETVRCRNQLYPTEGYRSIAGSGTSKHCRPTKVQWHPASDLLGGTAYEDGHIKLFDIRTRSFHTEWKAHESTCSDFNFLPGHLYTHTCVSAGKEDGFLYVWDTRQCGTVLHAFKFSSGVASVAVAEDSSAICVATTKGDLQIMNVPLVEAFVHVGYRPSASSLNSYTHVEFSKNGRYVLLTGVEEPSSRTKDATGISTFPICEVWDLQDPYTWYQMKNTATHWIHMKKHEAYRNEANAGISFEAEDACSLVNPPLDNATTMKEQKLLRGDTTVNDERSEGRTDSSESLQEHLLHSTCWQGFPRVIAVNELSSQRLMGIHTHVDTEKTPELKYKIYENKFDPLSVIPDTEVTVPQFYDSEEDEGCKSHYNENELTMKTIDRKRKLHKRVYLESSAEKAFSAASFTNDKELGGNPIKYRPYRCCFGGDTVVGVGGPKHFGGAMKLWDAMSGFMLSATVTAECMDLITQIVPNSLGGPFFISGGWDSKQMLGRMTLWNYVTLKELEEYQLV